MKSQESHVWQQAFTPHCHSFSAGQGLSELAAGWRIMAGIEKCYASANYQMKLLQRIDDIISPVQDFGQGLTPGKHPRQTLPDIPIIETEQSHQIDVNF